MGGPAAMNGGRSSITLQAARRLVVSLVLFVGVVAVSAVTVYRAAIEKAAHERADDLRGFYQSRLVQQERDWELQTRDLRVRIEYSRLLDQPRSAAVNLQAFMTLQGSDRRFNHMAIQDRRGEPVFRFGAETPERLPARLAEGMHYFFETEDGELYRVVEEPIWLGVQGMGRMWVFFPIDNALLGRLAAPGVSLTAQYQGRAVASSLGALGITPMAADESDVQTRTIAWSAKGPVDLVIRAPEKVLFTSIELGIAASVVPILMGLILWFTLGTWLIRQTRRINALEQAVRDSSDGAEGNQSLERKLSEASAGLNDEIHAVAQTLRRTTAQRDVAEGRIVSLNEELKGRNGQLESLNAELESFIYSVSHDLRAPLRAIAGYSAILEEDYGDRIDATGREFLQRLGLNAERMAQRIDDLLYLSRISRQEMDWTEVDLAAMAAGIVAELRERNPERQVEVSIASPMVAFADARLMSVALSNLIANAWKFTLRTPDARIEIGSAEHGGEKVYWIRDNGAGFDPALLKRLFLPFHRLHSDSEFEGTGLGLAIVERVIRRHGGRIWADGAVEKGATFRFSFERAHHTPLLPDSQTSVCGT